RTRCRGSRTGRRAEQGVGGGAWAGASRGRCDKASVPRRAGEGGRVLRWGGGGGRGGQRRRKKGTGGANRGPPFPMGLWGGGEVPPGPAPGSPPPRRPVFPTRGKPLRFEVGRSRGGSGSQGMATRTTPRRSPVPTHPGGGWAPRAGPGKQRRRSCRVTCV